MIKKHKLANKPMPFVGGIPQSRVGSIVDYKALNNKALFNSIVTKPITEAGGTKPNMVVFQNFIETINLNAIISGNFAPPSKEGMARFEKLASDLLKMLETREFENHYQNLWHELHMARGATKNLKEKREAEPRAKSITSDLKIKICTHLSRWWYSHTKKKITGTYDNKPGAEPEYYNTQNIRMNPGAFFIQQVFGEYFGDRMNNKQIKDLIVATKKAHTPVKAVIIGD